MPFFELLWDLVVRFASVVCFVGNSISENCTLLFFLSLPVFESVVLVVCVLDPVFLCHGDRWSGNPSGEVRSTLCCFAGFKDSTAF